MLNINMIIARLLHTTLIGEIKPYAGSGEPAGWMKCDGRAVSRSAYAALFNAIGTTYGAGDGNTTFNIPDLRDRFPVGAGNSYALNAKGGANTVTLTKEQSGLPAHSHGFTQPTIESNTSGYTLLAANGPLTYKAAASGSAVTRLLGDSTGSSSVPRSGAKATGGAVSQNTGANAAQSHENRPPYIGINFLIYVGGGST